MRQIFLLIVLFIAGHWLSRALRRSQERTSSRTRPHPADGARPAAASSPRLAEPMIRCVECGVHAPKSDSIVVAGNTFCCSDHAQRYAARPASHEAQ